MRIRNRVVTAPFQAFKELKWRPVLPIKVVSNRGGVNGLDSRNETLLVFIGQSTLARGHRER